jgi:hypothetical protein
MTLELLIGQLGLILFNITNAYIDAFRILKNKTIAHAINFGAYLAFAGLLCLLLSLPAWPAILFLLSAFFNRQLSFDIPLNLRRGLPWDYQSTANPPKAVLDRIERKLFGVGDVGKQIATIYMVCYFTIINLWVWIL